MTELRLLLEDELEDELLCPEELDEEEWPLDDELLLLLDDELEEWPLDDELEDDVPEELLLDLSSIDRMRKSGS